jgi:replicative superfamily II helicase
MPTKSPSTKTAKKKQPTHEAIEVRAYEISQSTGNGDAVANWLEAERQLVESAAPKPRRRKVAEKAA